MSIRRTVSAPLRNTFGVAAQAGLLVECDDTGELIALLTGELAGAAPLVLGGGSNLLIVEGPALALAPTAREVRVLGHGQLSGDHAHADPHRIVRADAGVEWDRFVRWTLAQGLAGLENLALIPGTVGAAPIQNIGAYGVEVGERIHAVEAIDRRDGTLRRFSAADCAFAYRDSLFKQDLDRWLIVAVEFALPPADDLAPDGSGPDSLRLEYSGIREELAAMGVGDADAATTTARITPALVCGAVTRLRRRKLPDPAVVGNAGSFFKNPIVPAATAEALRRDHPELPVFPAGDDALRKLSAAWLIDACGWKGRRWNAGSGDAGVSERHALVLVNHGRASGAELLALARAVAADVEARFGIRIEPEPRLVGATW